MRSVAGAKRQRTDGSKGQEGAGGGALVARFAYDAAERLAVGTASGFLITTSLRKCVHVLLVCRYYTLCTAGSSRCFLLR